MWLDQIFKVINDYLFIFQTIEGKGTEINRLKEEKSKIEKEFDSCKLIVS